MISTVDWTICLGGFHGGSPKWIKWLVYRGKLEKPTISGHLHLLKMGYFTFSQLEIHYLGNLQWGYKAETVDATSCTKTMLEPCLTPTSWDNHGISSMNFRISIRIFPSTLADFVITGQNFHPTIGPTTTLGLKNSKTLSTRRLSRWVSMAAE